MVTRSRSRGASLLVTLLRDSVSVEPCPSDSESAFDEEDADDESLDTGDDDKEPLELCCGDEEPRGVELPCPPPAEPASLLLTAAGSSASSSVALGDSPRRRRRSRTIFLTASLKCSNSRNHDGSSSEPSPSSGVWAMCSPSVGAVVFGTASAAMSDQRGRPSCLRFRVVLSEKVGHNRTTTCSSSVLLKRLTCNSRGSKRGTGSCDRCTRKK